MEEIQCRETGQPVTPSRIQEPTFLVVSADSTPSSVHDAIFGTSDWMTSSRESHHPDSLVRLCRATCVFPVLGIISPVSQTD
ncbi:hypothetical protein ASPZODRAFT_131556 [Penicilliopsis zonata CBS 506.65]|uniref:Uncharacterized protein n=1 Tax=Penicilliopsis zonata CBS 506.65 TaxID=1073090 RepID=A0A1L9SKZ9_9EURO|nr:hypothetical protein ASPZODRAFT_131556 [Penicilliopsis zonata CBS 506.65]OJJ47942.1 hypothetical protein ASPZODRAFT_131556 [Penicilliopsis zonata CBS 506.65]